MNFLPFPAMDVEGIRNALLAFIGFCLMIVLSNPEELDNMVFNPLREKLTFNYEAMEPVFLGTVVLLTILAVLAAPCVDMLTRPEGVRPITSEGWFRSAVRRIADSAPGQGFRQDGVRGVLRAV